MNLKGKKICIHTLGCKVNRAESDTILGMLEDLGATICEEIEPCDIYIINTCAVTNEAERKSRNLITKAIKQNPNAKIYILGCSSQNNPIRFRHKNVKAIFGTGHKTEVINAILNDLSGEFIVKPDYMFEEIPVPKTKRTRAYVRVQEGCNNFCTYCIIPYLRGRSRSRDFESVKKEILELSKNTKEIVITGVNTADYGKDLSSDKTLIDICDIFKSLDNNTRFRFSSLEFIKIIDDEFLERLQENPNFCDQFHLSLQSGSDLVLKSMNRHYNSQEFIDSVNLIRKYFPNAGITTDIIVGFPTETEEEFKNSIETCKKCNFTDIHVFPFSMREGTVASKLYKELNGEIVDKRKKEMLLLKEELHTSFLNSQIGNTLEVLCEKYNDGMNEGYSRNFTRCYVKSDKNLHNEFIKVKPLSIYKDGLLCEIL